MASTFDDTVLDFDLNFLQQPNSTVNECKYDKQRKAVLIAKKKIIATDSLIRKYYTKNEKLEQTEVLLLASKEECKQVCIDYKETLEKYTQLEKDIQSLKTKNEELEESNILATNQCEAIKSHAKQLQVLVTEHETVIEALKIENQLNKNNSKDYDKKLLELQKENETVLKHLCLVKDIVLGKKKLKKRHKLLLQKYDKIKTKSDAGNSSEDSADENDFFDSLPPSPLFGQDVIDNKKGIVFNLNGKVNFGKKVIEDHESDYSNEVVSEDTGRGSSLAFSDGEKCYNSPDYCHTDSPFNADTNRIKERRVYVDVGTSPTHQELVHMSTSPVMFGDVVRNDNCKLRFDLSEVENNINKIPINNCDTVTIKENIQKVDVGTSPMEVDKTSVSTSPVMFDDVNIVICNNVEESVPITVVEKVHASTSPLVFEEVEQTNKQSATSVSDENMTSVNKLNKTSNEVSDISANNAESTQVRYIQDLTSQCEIEISGKSSSIEEKKCLEKNNSNNVCIESANDGEIEMILNSMRLTDRLITPIPKTPVKLSKKKCKQTLSPIPEKSVAPNEHIVCVDAMKVREENKVLKTSISDLNKEIMNIKRILKNQMLMPESPKKQVNEKTKALMADLFDDSSQETIVISVDSETNKEKHCASENVSYSDNVNKEPSTKLQTEENIVNNNEVSNENVVIILEEAEEVDSVHNSSMEENVSSIDVSRKISDCLQNEDQYDKNSSLRHNSCQENISLKSKEKNISTTDHDKKTDSDTDALNEALSKRKSHSHKLTRLEKFRKKLLPKSKIACAKIAPVKRVYNKASVPVAVNPVCNPKSPTNNQSAYEKAVSIMKELKEKEKNKVNEAKPAQAERERQKSKSESEEKTNSVNKVHIVDNVVIKQPVVCLSQLNLEKMLNKSGSDQELSDSEIHYVVEIVDTPTKNYMTRSRSKMSDQESVTSSRKSSTESISKVPDRNYSECEGTPPRKRFRRASSEATPENTCKRVLRSSNNKEMRYNNERSELPNVTPKSSPELARKTPQKRNFGNFADKQKSSVVKDISKMFPKSNEPLIQYDITEEIEAPIVEEIEAEAVGHPKHSILCKMIDKYGKAKIKFNAKKVPDNVVNCVSKKLEDSIAHITELPADKAKPAMAKLVEEIQNNWNLKNFLAGFLKYLKDPTRKAELFNKVNSPPAPPMTKAEQVVLYVVKHLSVYVPDFVDIILNHIEFTLFQLNKSPEFGVIESLAHIYALICRYFGLKMRLRLFILDAMYCLSFKVVPLIKQCLDVWMHILPLAHMGIAKSPLVTCLVYLLHFYKCEDRYNRVQEIRLILNRKYFYQITDWNETKILELFKTSIMELRDIPTEKKMLRVALIILAKRHGPDWCQKNIIKKMLMPLLEQEDVPIRIKQFCIEMLGPLLKPYPVDMKVHCEIVVNNLLDMLDQNPPDTMKESIFTSLIYMSKHNQNRVMQALLSWTPKKVTPEFEQLLRDFVQEKPIKSWKGILSRITF